MLHFFQDDTARGGPEQMALDEALLETATAPVLRIYRWDAPAVSFGYAQSLAAVRKSHPALPVVRRWTGGGIVAHGSDLTFSLVVPGVETLAKLRPLETYRLIHEVFAGLLDGHLVRAGETAPGEACFTAPALHDVTSQDGRKLCGGAQRRTRRGFLHQGSIQNVHFAENLGRRMAGIFAGRTTGFQAEADLFSRTNELATGKYGSEWWTGKIS